MGSEVVRASAERPLITVDTSAMVSLLNGRDRDHARVRTALLQDGGPYLVPAWILGELTYVAQVRIGGRAVDSLLEDLGTGAFTLDCGDRDIPRIRELVSRYSDLPLGVADAAVVACAERNGGRVLTLDRDFEVVAKERKITVHP